MSPPAAWSKPDQGLWDGHPGLCGLALGWLTLGEWTVACRLGPATGRGHLVPTGQQWPAPVLVFARQRRGVLTGTSCLRVCPQPVDIGSGHSAGGWGAGCPGSWRSAWRAGLGTGGMYGLRGQRLQEGRHPDCAAHPSPEDLFLRLSVGPQPPGCPSFAGQGDCGCLRRTSPRGLTPCAQRRAEQ